jgi:hypothetical protein
MQARGIIFGIVLFCLGWIHTSALYKKLDHGFGLASGILGSRDRMITLRVGSDTVKPKDSPSGIWDMYRKIGAPEVNEDTDTVGYGLKEKKPCKWGKVSNNLAHELDGASKSYWFVVTAYF